MQEATERRAHQRYAKHLPVTAYFVDGGAEGVAALAVDASLGGIRLRLAGKIPEGSTVDLVLPLGSGRLIEAAPEVLAVGRVIRVVGKAGAFEVAVRFTRVHRIQRQLLGQYLRLAA